MGAFELCLLVFAFNVALGFKDPDSALPKLQYDYSPKGSFDEIDGLPIYVSDIYMPEQREGAGRCVVWAYDVFAWVSPGRGFEMVDLLNGQTGMIVVFPDFFRGEQYNETYQWDNQLQARQNHRHTESLFTFQKTNFSLIGMIESSLIFSNGIALLLVL